MWFRLLVNTPMNFATFTFEYCARRLEWILALDAIAGVEGEICEFHGVAELTIRFIDNVPLPRGIEMVMSILDPTDQARGVFFPEE